MVGGGGGGNFISLRIGNICCEGGGGDGGMGGLGRVVGVFVVEGCVGGVWFCGVMGGWFGDVKRGRFVVRKVRMFKVWERRWGVWLCVCWGLVVG